MTLIFILGPTASGKTKISVEIAKKIDGEIIGADSVQIYKDLVIGAASPTENEMDGINHHLIGIKSLEEEISAGIYIEMANVAINDVFSRSRCPIVVGGTNFYVDALIHGLSPVPEIDDKVKEECELYFEMFKTADLYSTLLETDPEWAKQISSPNDRQRIKRGLLVRKVTGKNISDWNKFQRINKYEGSILAFAVDIERDELYRNINQRSENMVNSGLIEEVESLNSRGFNSFNCKPLNSIGYIETEFFLKGAISSKIELIETIAKNTRHLAKRQMTWLKNRSYVTWKSGDDIVKSVSDCNNFKI